MALRCAGFNNVDLAAAAALGMPVVRVPAYSPHAVAEFTVGMILTLNRQIHRAYNRTRENNFALDGLLGFDLVGKTVGVIGTGKIGALVARSMKLGFGCEVLAHDVVAGPGTRSHRRHLCRDERAHRPLRHHHPALPADPATRHLVNARTIAMARPGVMLVNTSRGALVDVEAVVDGLKSGQIGYLAIDVYEQEADLFFQDLSNEIIQDDAFQRLLTFPNVLVTGHQAFFTARGAGRHRGHDARQHHGVRARRAAGERGGRGAGEAALRLRGRCCGRERRGRRGRPAPRSRTGLAAQRQA